MASHLHRSNRGRPATVRPGRRHAAPLWRGVVLGMLVAWGLGAPLAPLAASTKPRPDHPLLGTWKLEVPGEECVETYHFRPDGTSLVTSAAEVAESEFEISDEPSARGFYRMTDRIVRDNGKPDCMGEVLTPGSQVVRYLRFHPLRPEFIMCDEESLDACIGPFESDAGIAV